MVLVVNLGDFDLFGILVSVQVTQGYFFFCIFYLACVRVQFRVYLVVLNLKILGCVGFKIKFLLFLFWLTLIFGVFSSERVVPVFWSV